MLPTAIANEMTTAIRDFSNGVETQGRALGSSVRHLQVPSTRVAALTAFLLRVSCTLTVPGIREPEDQAGVTQGCVVVDKRLTRC